jgi:hypothetical protein
MALKMPGIKGKLPIANLLRRLFLEKDVPWALKGGHALEIRLQRARGTKDIDLALKKQSFSRVLLKKKCKT